MKGLKDDEGVVILDNTILLPQGDGQPGNEDLIRSENAVLNETGL